MSRLFSIDPVGILKACTTKVRTKRARMTATQIDSKYSRAVDLRCAGASAPDAAATRADYALCRRCGVVFARRRPVGARFRYLIEHFEDSFGTGESLVDSGVGTAEAFERRIHEKHRRHKRKKLALSAAPANHAPTAVPNDAGYAERSQKFH